MKTLFQILTIMVIACLFVMMGIGIGNSYHQKDHITDPIIKVDSSSTTDTTSVLEPISDPSREIVTKILRIPYQIEVTDSSALSQIDSLLGKIASLERVNDSLFLVLKRTQIKYQSPQFQAWVSGYDPKLDSIKLFQTTKTITKEIPVIQKQKPRFSLGVTGGYGAGKDGLTPFVGVGLTYNLLSW